MSQAKDPLLDHRYQITGTLRITPEERWYAARHVELDIPVRIVTINAEPSAGALRALASGTICSLAAKASALRHPLLPGVRDCFVRGHDYFLVTDPLPTETLAARVARTGPLPLREALALGLQLCDALSYVQRRASMLLPFGTIMPEGLYLGSDRRVVLGDLGVCRWPCRPAALANARPTDSALASSANAVPEVRADLRDVAAVLSFALTAWTPEPFDCGVWQPSLPDLDVPSAVAEVIAKGMEAGRADALWTPEAFGAALAQAARRSLPAATALPPRTDSGVRLATDLRGTAREGLASLSASAAISWRAENSLRRTGERAWTALATALHWIG